MPETWEAWVWSPGWKDPWRRTWQPTPVFLPGESPWTEEPDTVHRATRRQTLLKWPSTQAGLSKLLKGPRCASNSKCIVLFYSQDSLMLRKRMLPGSRKLRPQWGSLEMGLSLHLWNVRLCSWPLWFTTVGMGEKKEWVEVNWKDEKCLGSTCPKTTLFFYNKRRSL